MSRRLTLGLTAAALTIWAGAAWASEGSAPAAEPRLVALAPLIVPIVEHGAIVGKLEVRAMWKAGSEPSDTEARLPQLRAALVEGAAEHARLAAAPGQAVDPAELSERLEKRTRRAGFSGELLVLEAATRGA